MRFLGTSNSWLTGYIPDLPTPFDEAGKVDEKAFARLCERQIEAGVPALVVCETTGEASTLSATERELIIRTAVEIAQGRTRVIAGAGSNSTGQAMELTRRAEAGGADQVLLCHCGERAGDRGFGWLIQFHQRQAGIGRHQAEQAQRIFHRNRVLSVKAGLQGPEPTFQMPCSLQASLPAVRKHSAAKIRCHI